MLGSIKPPMHRLPRRAKQVRDASYARTFLNKLFEGSSNVGRQPHTIHPANKYGVIGEISVTLED